MSKPRPSYTIDHDGETQALITKRHELKTVRDTADADIDVIDEKLNAIMAEHRVTGLMWAGKLVAYVVSFSKTQLVKGGAELMAKEHPRLAKKYLNEVPIEYTRVP